MVEKRQKPNAEETGTAGGGTQTSGMHKDDELPKNEVIILTRKRVIPQKTKRKPKKKKKVKMELIKFKYVEPIDDDHVMEYGLSEEDIMKYRKHHFKIENPPIYEVRTNKSSEMKEEFGTYCGLKKTIKNWLYFV